MFDIANNERRRGQTIHDFIDTKYTRFEKKSMKLSSEILAFTLLQKYPTEEMANPPTKS